MRIAMLLIDANCAISPLDEHLGAQYDAPRGVLHFDRNFIAPGHDLKNHATVLLTQP